MNKKRVRVQVTCNCSAYEFPHRLGGGKCNGSEWAESYLIWIREECDLCNCLRDYHTCDVISGAESIRHCEGFQDHLRRQPYERLPIKNIEEYTNFPEEE